MSHDTTSNNADIAIAHKAQNKDFKNEAKIKFINFKSQNVNFFNGEDSLPHFPLPENENCHNVNSIDTVDEFPKKQINFFNELNDTFSNEKDFNSYLFKNK